MLHNFRLSKSVIPATGKNMRMLETYITYVSIAINICLVATVSIKLSDADGIVLLIDSDLASFAIGILLVVFLGLVSVFLLFTALN